MRKPTSDTPANGKINAIGLAWYRESDYPAALKIMADSANMQRTYKPWHDIMCKKERELQAQGFIVYRAIIDPNTFPDWCRRNGFNVDSKGRIAFAGEYAARQIRK